MSESAVVNVGILSNARNFQIGELHNNIVSGNLYISGNDQATLLQLLQPAPDASHTRDRATSPPDSACFPGTRKDVIHRIIIWADSSLLWNTHVLWLYGYVGCGKSAIALAIALEFEERNRLVGSFFFFRNTGDRSRMTKFASTLACQLAAAIPEAAPYIEMAVRTKPGLFQWGLAAQLRHLVYEPFKAVAWSRRLLWITLLKGPFLIVIDGLDECEDRQGVEAFIEDMLDLFKRNPFIPLRFFITSRVEQHIQGRLENNNNVRLENLVNHCSRDDIDTFMSICFAAERQRNPVVKAFCQEHEEWPTKRDKDLLVDHIGGSFIFASALFKYIVDPSNKQSTPMERLPNTLKMNPGLDALYAETLSRAQDLPHFSDVISTLALLFVPLHILGIAELLGIKTFEVVRVLINLQAIIYVPGTDDLPVTMCHTSLRDFLTSQCRSGPFFTPPSYHLHLLDRWSILYDRRQSRTAAVQYGIDHGKNHFKQLALLPSDTQLSMPHLPSTLHTIFTRVLAKSQDLPYFSDIISILTLLGEPLPIIGIAELLGIEASEVSLVLASLQAIIGSPGIEGDDPVIMYHTSLHDLLTTETRAGIYFVSPLYHLKLSYYCFNLNFDHRLNRTPPSEISRQYSIQHCQYHWDQFLPIISEQSILAEIKELPHLPGRDLSYHLFSFTQVFFWLFGDHPNQGSQQVLQPLTECIESLALALECDPDPKRWLQDSFNMFRSSISFMNEDVYCLEIRQEHATILQSKIGRIEQMIRRKYPDGLSKSPLDLNIDHFISHWRLSDWTLMEASNLFRWIVARVRVEMGQGVTCDFNLRIVTSQRESRITASVS